MLLFAQSYHAQRRGRVSWNGSFSLLDIIQFDSELCLWMNMLSIL